MNIVSHGRVFPLQHETEIRSVVLAQACGTYAAYLARKGYEDLAWEYARLAATYARNAFPAIFTFWREY
jgi:hypothetical protein